MHTDMSGMCYIKEHMGNWLQNVFTNTKVEKELVECALCMTMKAKGGEPITMVVMKTVGRGPQYWAETCDPMLYNLIYTALEDRQEEAAELRLHYWSEWE